jgi:opacity protein-like surface antigen
MKRITAMALGLVALAAVPATAMAADMDAPTDYTMSSWYIRGDIGASWLTWDGEDDNGFAIGGGVGYQFNENLRTDVRVDWAGNYDIGKGRDMGVTTALGNLYFDIPTGTMLTPYLGAGAGYGWVPVDGGEDRDGFAYALMAGVGVDLSDNLTADVGYRFRNVLAGGDDPMEHQLLVGLRYKF